MTIIDRSEEKETSTSFLTPSIIRNSRKTKKDILIKLLIFIVFRVEYVCV